MVSMGGWKPQSQHGRVVTTDGNYRRVETTESPWEGGNHKKVVSTDGNHGRVSLC